MPPSQSVDTDRDHAIEWLWPADGVHGRDGSSGLVEPSAALRDRAVHAGVQPGEHTAARDALAAALGWRAALCWRGLASVPEGARMGYQITAPPGITISNVVYDVSTVAEHRRRARLDRVDLLERRHCAGASERDRGRRGCVRSAEHSPTGGSSCAACSRCARGQGEIQLNQYRRCMPPRRRGRASRRLPDPGSLWNQTGHWIWNAPGNAWSLP